MKDDLEREIAIKTDTVAILQITKTHVSGQMGESVVERSNLVVGRERRIGDLPP